MKASITIATHNRADALDKTIASIFRQQVPFPFEVIVVDDGSNDHTSDVLAKYPVITSRIERAPVHRNPAPARNLAIALSSGDILIMQSDDVLHHSSNAIEELVAQVDAHPDSAVFATVVNVNEHGVAVSSYVSPRRRRAFFFLGAIRREHILAIGGNDEEFNLPGYEDAWLRDCLEHGLQTPFVFLASVVAHHQDHPRPKERYGGTMLKGGRGLIEMHRLYYAKLAAARAGTHPWRAKLSSLYDHA